MYFLHFAIKYRFEYSCNIMLSDIYNDFNCIKSTTCSGPGSILNIFFTNCKFVLSIPLLYLFNIPLISSIFPDNKKIYYILPVFKGNDITVVANYRPIFIISIYLKFSKYSTLYNIYLI